MGASRYDQSLECEEKDVKNYNKIVWKKIKQKQNYRKNVFFYLSKIK